MSQPQRVRQVYSAESSEQSQKKQIFKYFKRIQQGRQQELSDKEKLNQIINGVKKLVQGRIEEQREQFGKQRKIYLNDVERYKEFVFDSTSKQLSELQQQIVKFLESFELKQDQFNRILSNSLRDADVFRLITGVGTSKNINVPSRLTSQVFSRIVAKYYENLSNLVAEHNSQRFSGLFINFYAIDQICQEFNFQELEIRAALDFYLQQAEFSKIKEDIASILNQTLVSIQV